MLALAVYRMADYVKREIQFTGNLVSKQSLCLGALSGSEKPVDEEQ